MNKSSPPLLFALAQLLAGALPSPAADARVSSWFMSESTRYARVRETDGAAAAGAITWTGQTLPAYAGVQEVASDATYVYVRSHGLAGYVMGPWYNDVARAQLFPNRPLARNNVWRFPRAATIPGTRTLTGLGPVGLYVNGVSLFDNRDAFVWNGTTEAMGAGYWWRDAYVNEGVTFDGGGAHQEQTGNYHYHAQPPALRLQLGDNISSNAAGGGSVAPGGSASRGSTVTVTITLPTTPPQPPANLVPVGVTLAGSIAGAAISRPSAGTVLATFAIPANAPVGAQNVVVTFNPAPTYTLSGAFTIQ